MKMWCDRCGGDMEVRYEDCEWTDYVYYVVCNECDHTLERRCGFRHGEIDIADLPLDGADGDST